MIETILCVDDDPIALMLCKTVISKTSFSKEIVIAKNGEEALKYFDEVKTIATTKNRPQLIFLDLNMPVMNGWEFLDSFGTSEYAEFYNTKIIILSSTIDPDDFEKSKKYSTVIDFLSKPISKEMIESLKIKFK